ncbi:MAG: alpha-2-macroglobulin, partial [Pirellulales bacterium]|nr:alpha-2-macroglobulin [Pirellulales bacterium]
MNGRRLALAACVGSVLCLVTGAAVLFSAPPGGNEARNAARKQFDAGNFQDALSFYEPLATDPQSDPVQVPDDLRMAVQSLRNLGRVDECDALIEKSLAAQPKNWRLLAAAAELYAQLDHFGQVIANEFTRGNQRGRGEFVGCFERDRVRSLQLAVKALELAADDPARTEIATLYKQVADVLMSNRYGAAWKLQTLTDLTVLPDYEAAGGWGRGWSGGSQGAPVDAEDNPVVYRVPATWEAAANDGERWRWALAQAVAIDPQRADEVTYTLAMFWHGQFGVQTLADYGYWFGRDQAERAAGGKDGKADDAAEEHDESGTYALHTLADEETICRLAIGVRRIKLDDEFNAIKLLAQLADKRESGYAETALTQLADIFTNRRQYDRAAEYLRRNIAEHGKSEAKQQALAQIVDNWGRFEGQLAQAAGRGATIDYRFRNGRQVHFTAREIKLEALLAAVKQYLKSNPEQLDWQQLDITQLGHRLVIENQAQFLGREVANWTVDLEPRPNHFDARTSVATPLQKAGAYLLTADMQEGNRSHVIVWLHDTALVQKPLSNQHCYFVADATSGAPVPKANVEFFGYRQEHRGGRRFTVLTSNFAEFSDADGLVRPSSKRLDPQYNWLVIARTNQGRLAYLGFQNVWYATRSEARYDSVKTLLITDRPIYRPDQKVQYKLWVRHPRYDEPAESEFAGRSFQLVLTDPQGEKVLTQEVKADAYGGIAGEYALPRDAKLGVWQIYLENVGGGSFRVEEYKKPEYEVTVDAPAEPIRLGDKFTATITARYYFGSPVTEARVKYKVLRTPNADRWFPSGPWDWLYGSGYIWLGSDYDWYPGFTRWGCIRPIPPWWGFRPQQPPEVVVEQEVPIGPDGTVQVEIDSALARAIHGDQDHRYEITAEVVDQSRRTVVGTGSVLAARRPFEVTVWVDRGFSRTGETLRAQFAARTLTGQPVRGTAVLELLRITYNDQQEPVETKVEDWELTSDEGGQGQQQLVAAAPGQYRLSCRVTDAAGHTIEGGYVFVVRGEAFDGRDFRFNELELIPSKREYAPGETLELMINTNRADSTVLLFVRPQDGVYPAPQVVRLHGKSTTVSIPIAVGDMPNFFVEAVTVSGGKLHSEVREIFVPPAARVAQIEVLPSAQEYLPGQEAKVQLKLTDLAGQPFVGSTVLAIYDKAVDAVAGGSNVPEIKQFFWQWRRSHSPTNVTNLGMMYGNLVPKDAVPMQNLGMFGETVVDELMVRRVGRGAGAMDAAVPMAAPAPEA